MTNENEILFLAAVGLMAIGQKGSTSFIQRKLGIGYNVAAKLMMRMEDEGIVSKPNTVGKRDVLVGWIEEKLQ